MRLLDIAAQPYLRGQGVEIRWTIAAKEFAANNSWRVTIRRDEITFPEKLTDGAQVETSEGAAYTLDAEGNAHFRCLDASLRGETVYYYTLFPFTGPDNAKNYDIDRLNRVSALTTQRYGLADHLYQLLPAIYHRYDTLRSPDPATFPEELRDAGQLRRFIEISGAQYDQFYSQIRSLLHLHDIERVDGSLLTLLGDWIGWNFDLRQRINGQRNELRFAPYIYQTIGIVPTIEATVKRVIGWEGRVKEYVHNVFMTNAPEQFILRSLEHTGADNWVKVQEPVSIDAAYGGPLALATDSQQRTWLFYETLQDGRWEIWQKLFAKQSSDPAAKKTWRESRVARRGEKEYRHPAVAFWQGKLYLFWHAYDRKQGRWQIEYRIGDGNDNWERAETFGPLSTTSRTFPAVVVDQVNNHLWLFWRERSASQDAWVTRYSRFDTTDAIEPSGSFVALDLTNDTNDLFPLIRSSGGVSELSLLWARGRPANPSTPEIAPHLSEIAFLTKGSIDPAQNDWGAIETLPKPLPDIISDSEPFVLPSATGDLELFWTSTQAGSKAIWRAVRSGASWSAREKLTGSPFTQRNPAAFVDAGKTILLYRDNEGLRNASSLYTATETLDLRYAGSTTFDGRNRAKMDLRGRFEDFQTYLYDSGKDGKRGPDNRYARDTIAIFLTPNTIDQTLIKRGAYLIESALRQFLPIQVRVILEFESSSYNEVIYSYSFGKEPPPWLTPDEVIKYVPRFIGEEVIDEIPETITRVRDDAMDFVADWRWINTWQVGAPVPPVPVIVNTAVAPIDTHFRTFHKWLKEG